MLNKIKQLVPTKIRSKFTNRPMVQKITKNMGWLAGERLLELLVALTVGVWVARYLGPSDFGLMSFAIAFTALFSPFIDLGLSTVLHRELIDKPEKSNLLLGTVFRIKFFSSVFVGCLMLFLIFLIRPNDFLLFLMLGIFALGNIINSFCGINNYFHSNLTSNKAVKSSSIALILSNLLKIFFILFGFSVLWFVIASLFGSIITVLTQIYYYFKEKQSVFNWKFDFLLAKSLLSLSWPLILSSFFVIIYLHIDQVMIGLLLNEYELGLYSVAAKFSQLGYFLPSAIAISLFPTILQSRKTSSELYFKRLQKMFDFFSILALIIIVPTVFLSNFIILFLYGVEYAASGFVLSILIWGLLAIFVRFVVDMYINSEKLYKINLYSTLIGAIINILANILLIPTFGIIGAAFATLISYFFVVYICNLFFKETRKLFKMQVKSFNLIRIIYELKK